jgi:PAS domain S-box-containing protein
MVLDRDGMVRLVNPALSEMLGYEAGQLLHAAPPEAVSRMLFGQAGAGQFPEAGYVSQERQYQTPGGARRTLSVSMSLMKDGGGEALAAVATIRDITQAVAAQEQIQKLAYYDALTNLPNRLLLKERFSRAIARAERARGQAAVLFLDLDRFKQVNDTLGHDAGDQLLKAVAERVVKCVRESDLVVRNAQSEEAEEEAGGTTLARLGGDEFVLLLSPIERGEDAAKVARRILQSLSQPVKVKGGVEVGTGVSIGISLYPGDGEDAETLMKKADLAMYHAKETGRNGFRFFDQEFNDRVVKRFGFETSLRRAMGGPELLLGYRPVVDAAGRAVGLVAEVEWEHPQKGRLGADEFLPGALDSGLVGPLYDWLLRTTTFQLRAWNGSSLGSPWVLVPVDAGVFERTGLVETVRESLAQTRLDPARLVIALGGLTARMDRARLLPVLAALQGLGVRLALDGFGSGRVSLADVTGVPVRMVRMVAPPADDEDARALAEALLRMVHGLGLQAVAGGAVDVGAVRVARELGFDFVCGDGVAPAVHAEDVVETVARLATGGAGAPA